MPRTKSQPVGSGTRSNKNYTFHQGSRAKRPHSASAAKRTASRGPQKGPKLTASILSRLLQKRSGEQPTVYTSRTSHHHMPTFSSILKLIGAKGHIKYYEPGRDLWWLMEQYKHDPQQIKNMDAVVQGGIGWQRFPYQYLLKEPSGVEGEWKRSVVINDDQLNSHYDYDKGNEKTTILYHSSMDNFTDVPKGSVLYTNDPTWHHTAHVWRFFKKSERTRVQMRIPYRVLQSALEKQKKMLSQKRVEFSDSLGLRKPPVKNLGAKIERQLLFEKKHSEMKKMKINYSDQPLLTNGRHISLMSPKGLRNGSGYVTVVMPPFYARVTSNTRGNATTPGLVKLDFLGFVDDDESRKSMTTIYGR
jgi:hypothetical protein